MSAPIAAPGSRVLVVDDDPTVPEVVATCPDHAGFTVDRAADGPVAVTPHREADSVVLSVTDGCGGIPPEELPRVFDTGWRGTDARTPPAGAGLGPAIVRGIVEAHHGRAAVRNVPGGCRFEVRLPAAV